MSHIKNAEAFGKLIGQCTGYAGGYQPGSSNLQLASMHALLAEARASLDAVYSAKVLFDNATNSRELAFKEMRLRCTRVYNALRACGAHPLTLADARLSLQKMDGNRQAKVIAPAAEGATVVRDKKRQARGNDFISVTQHFAQFIETVEAEEKYATHEPELSVAQLNQLLATLKGLNELVLQATVQLVNARQKRNAVLYLKDWNVRKTFMAAKAYVKAAYGFNSAQYKEIAKISFTFYDLP